MEAESLKIVTTLDSKDRSECLLEYCLMESSTSYCVKVSKDNGKNKNEEYTSKYITNDKTQARKLIELLARNTVTPVTANNVLEDLGYI